MKKHTGYLIIIISFFLVKPGISENKIQENFNSLSNWSSLHFRGIKRHSSYAIIKIKDESFLKASSNNSASALIFKKKFNVYKTPILKWRCKISNTYEKINESVKNGDDFPIRIYIIFKYNPKQSSFAERFKYKALKLFYGKYPPHSSLNYVWASSSIKRVIINPYTNKSRSVIKQNGSRLKGNWIIEKSHIVRDYKKAFGVNPPAYCSIAIMNDSDNTKKKSISYIDCIEMSGIYSRYNEYDYIYFCR
jgi:DUF3047 family protein